MKYVIEVVGNRVTTLPPGGEPTTTLFDPHTPPVNQLRRIIQIGVRSGERAVVASPGVNMDGRTIMLRTESGVLTASRQDITLADGPEVMLVNSSQALAAVLTRTDPAPLLLGHNELGGNPPEMPFAIMYVDELPNEVSLQTYAVDTTDGKMNVRFVSARTLATANTPGRDLNSAVREFAVMALRDARELVIYITAHTDEPLVANAALLAGQPTISTTRAITLLSDPYAVLNGAVAWQPAA